MKQSRPLLDLLQTHIPFKSQIFTYSCAAIESVLGGLGLMGAYRSKKKYLTNSSQPPKVCSYPTAYAGNPVLKCHCLLGNGRIWVWARLWYPRSHYLGNLRRHFFGFASNAVSQRRRSAQALLTLALPSTQVA